MYTVTEVWRETDASFFKVKVNFSTLKLQSRGQKNVSGFSVLSVVIYAIARGLSSELHRPEKQASIFWLATGYVILLRSFPRYLHRFKRRSPDVRPFMCKYVVLCNRVTQPQNNWWCEWHSGGGERQGCRRPMRQSAGGGKIDILSEKKFHSLRSVSIKLLSQIRRNSVSEGVFFLIHNSCYGQSLWRLVPGHRRT